MPLRRRIVSSIPFTLARITSILQSSRIMLRSLAK